MCKCVCGTEQQIEVYKVFGGFSKGCLDCYYKSKQVAELTKYLNAVKRRAIRKGLEFSINEAEAQIIFDAQGGRCRLSGVPIVIQHRGNTSASLDRIDSSRGYTIDNIQWLHKTINTMKMAHSQQDFIALCKSVAERNEV